MLSEKVQKLITVLDPEGTIKNSITCLMPMIASKFKAEGEADAEMHAKEVLDLSFKAMTTHLPKFLEMQKKMFEENYTEEEVDALIQWHSSEMGRRLDKKSKALTAQLYEMNSKFVAECLNTAMYIQKTQANPNIGMA